MALAAIHHGADAIYVGVPGFNARGRSKDFTREELKDLIELCHLYGVKVHLAFNILVFESELKEAQALLQEILPLGPDALIVQDLGLVRLIRQMAPSQRIHGSTQMTVTSDGAIALLEDLNIQRFVLGRENSLSEIAAIRKQTVRELEVFVHGALCVAYSGQCFTSESLGGRSANRGQCAQSCRLGYELIVDGVKRDLGEKKFLVSPQDLCGINEVPKLIEIGVNSFKVEGRLKTPEYVATTARSYQEVIQGADPSEYNRQRDMAVSFGRGFFPGWLHGVDHQRLVEGSFSSHRGFEVGTIDKVLPKALRLKTKTRIEAGVGLFFASEGREVGGKVFEVRGPEVEMLAPFDYSALRPGMRVWINSDDKLKTHTQKTVSDRQLQKKIPLKLELQLTAGEPAKLVARDPESRRVEVLGAITEVAQKAATSPENAAEELGALGATAFRLQEFTLHSDGAYLSQKELKNLRRLMVEAMSAARVKVPHPVMGFVANVDSSPSQSSQARLNILLREKAQVEDFLAHKLDDEILGVVILDFEFGRDYADSVQLLKDAGVPVGIATTRVMKPNELNNLRAIERLNPDAILVRNLGALEYFRGKGPRLLGDFSLNGSNHLTVEYLLSKGLESVCASYDLNQVQLQELMSATAGEALEINLHQYMPEFHMEHCVFAAFMSKGSSFRDCGKPCEKHKVELKDAYGNMHFLKADQECRNTMFRATAQSAALLVENAPGRLWRFEALYERGDELISKIRAHLDLVGGRADAHVTAELVGSLGKYGVSAGTLAHGHDWQDRKKTL